MELRKVNDFINICNKCTTYSDAIDEYHVHEVDDTRLEQNVHQLENNDLSTNMSQSNSYAISELQRQAIMNSLNVYPLVDQTVSIINQYRQQIVDNSIQSTQSQIDRINQMLGSSNNFYTMSKDLQYTWLMLREIEKEYNQYKEIGGSYKHCLSDKY